MDQQYNLLLQDAGHDLVVLPGDIQNELIPDGTRRTGLLSIKTRTSQLKADFKMQ